MQDLPGKVAVITGAASGIGRAIAERFAREGMKVVLADIEQQALDNAVTELRRQEYDVLGVLTDVSKGESVEALAEATLRAYGKVHLACTNAGVFLPAKPMWESTLKDWEWILGVNEWGVINGIRTFVPIMLAQDEEGWVINTSSIGGLVTGSSIYGVTKHTVVALSEALHLQLKQRNAKIGVSVLCPLFVDTKIMASGRNRPATCGTRTSRGTTLYRRLGRVRRRRSRQNWCCKTSSPASSTCGPSCSRQTTTCATVSRTSWNAATPNRGPCIDCGSHHGG